MYTFSSADCLAFQINSSIATTKEKQSPTTSTTKTPPTLARPSSLAESFFLSSTFSQVSIPLAFFHHLSCSDCKTPSSCSLRIAFEIGSLHGEP